MINNIRKGFDCPYYVVKFKNHKKIKDDLLWAIDRDTNAGSIDQEREKLSKYDYRNISSEKGNSEYWKILAPNLQNPFMKFLKAYQRDNELLGIDGIDVSGFWYQQYLNKDFHGWHIHSGNDISVVYYLELPKGTPPTVFKDSKGKEHYPRVEEGDMLFFPSVLSHCSPPVKSNNRKSIVAINLRFRASNSI